MIYTGEFAELEKYKIDKKQKWPWKQNPKYWNKVASKGLKLCLFNHIFTNLFCLTLTSWLYNW